MKKKNDYWTETINHIYTRNRVSIDTSKRDEIYNIIIESQKSYNELDRLIFNILRHPFESGLLFSALQTVLCIIIFREQYVDFLLKLMGGM